MKKIKILLVGSGNIAKQHHKAFSSFPQFKFVGAVARNKKKLSNFANELKIPFFSNNLEKAHIKTNPDLVIVAVSILNTYKICLKLSKFKSILFVEKPLGYNYLETKKLVNLFNKENKKAFVALNRRHYETTRMIQKTILKNKNKRTIIINDQENLLDQKKNNFPQKVINNFMYANSIHLIDYFNIFCRGKLKKIKTFNSFNKKPYFVQSILNFSSGDRGIYSAIYNNQSPWYVSVFVGKKIYILKPLEKLTSNFKLTKKSINFSDDKNFKPGFRLQAKEVLNFFKKSSYNLSDYREYFKSVELINKIYK